MLWEVFSLNGFSRFIAMLLLVATLLPAWPETAAAYGSLSDPELGYLYEDQTCNDIGCRYEATVVSVDGDWARNDRGVKWGYNHGWQLYVDGNSVGGLLGLVDSTVPEWPVLNYVPVSNLTWWVNQLNGNPTHVASATKQNLLAANGKTSARIHIRQVVDESGGYISAFDIDKRIVYAYTTPKPTGNIPNLPQQKVGDTASWTLNIAAYSPSRPGLPRYSFTVNGEEVASGKDVSQNAHSFTASYKWPAAGTYALRLEVTDAVQRTSVITKSVTVAPLPGEPTSAFDLPATVEVNQPAQVVNRSAAAPGATLVSQVWTVTPATYTGTLSNTGGNLTFSAPGTYNVGLTVTDNFGKTATTTKQISVTAAPPPQLPGAPTASFDLPPAGEMDSTVSVVNRSTASAGASLVSQSWTVTPSTYSGSLGNAGGELRFIATGTYTVSLTVTDNNGKTATATRTIAISEPAAPPPAGPNASFMLAAAGETGTSVPIQNMSNAAPGAYLVSSAWTVSPSTYLGSLSPAGGSLTFTAAATYTVTLTVRDNLDQTATAVKSITITEAPPPPDPPAAGISMPATATQGETVTITSTSTDSDSQIVKYVWTVTPTGMVGTLTGAGGPVYFDQAGTYTVKLTVTDSQGLSDTAQRTIQIGPAVPEARFVTSGWPKQFREVTFDASSSRSPGRYPIDWSRTTWEYIPPTGVSSSAAEIIDATDPKLRKVQFAAPGDWRVRLTVYNTKGTASAPYEQTVRVTGDDPPVAQIVLPSSVIQGEDLEIRSNSYDPDGAIADYAWQVTPAGMIGTLTGEASTVYFDEPGTYSVRLTVTDQYGQQGSTEATIAVQPAVPIAYFNYTGWPKQNRKLVFDGSQSSGSERYPIDWAKTRWEFAPPAGGNAASVKIVADADLRTRQLLFKDPGLWTARLTVYNTKGTPSEVYEQTVEVYPDNPPVADFFTIKVISRDPEDSNYATIRLVDRSYSIDSDPITVRRWEYRFDSDNDGSFADETWVLLDGGNNATPSLRTARVGRYEFRLTATESFGQETIPAFITTADTRTADTGALPLQARMVEVINIRPVVNFDVIRKHKVDIVFTTGDTAPAKVEDLAAKITQHVETKLAAMQIQYGTIQSIESSTFSSNDAAADVIFNSWTRYGTNANTWEFDSVNKIIRRQNNDYWAGFYDPAFSSSEYTLEVEMATTGTDDDDIGITFGMNGGPSGSLAYILSGNNSRSFSYSSQTTNVHGHASGLYRYNGSTITGLVDTHQYEFVPNQWYRVKLTVSGRNAKIWLDGALVVDYTADRELTGSFGFFTNSQPQGAFRNLTLTSRTTRTLDDVIREPAWRPDAQHFLVNISDVPYPEFDDPEKAAVIYSRLLNDAVSFSVLGTTANRTQVEAVIARNDGNGTWIDNTNMDTALSQLADYIISQVIAQPRRLEQYVLLGQEVQYQTYYADRESDTELQRRWLYQHDPTVFRNSQGPASFDGQFLPQPVSRFDKVGRYDVQFQARDNPLNDDRFDNYRLWSTMPQDQLVLFVHRRPVARMTASLAPQESIETQTLRGSNIDFTGEGDYYAKWQPSVTAPAGFTVDRVEFCTARGTDDYLSTGTVQGYLNGTWVTIKSYGRQPNGAAVCDTLVVAGQGYTRVRFSFTMYDPAGSAQGSGTGSYYTIDVSKRTVTGYGFSELSSTSYDLDHQGEPGNGIVQEQWRWKPATGDTWIAGKPTTLALGETYLLALRVQDREGAWSDWTVQTLSTGAANMPPVAQFTVAPNPLPLTQTLTYADSSYDPNGHQIVQRRWRLAVQPGGSWVDYGATPPVDFRSLGLGEYRIELTVRDELDAWSEPYYQTVTVVPDNQKPVALFTASPNPLPLDVQLSYSDTSYDPDGDPLVSREWQYRKNGGTWVAGQPVDFASLGTGTYDIRLRVLDQPALAQMTPLWSDWYQRTVTVVPGNQKPVARFTLNPNPVNAAEPVTYTDTSYDPDGQPLVERLWQVTDETGQRLGEYSNALPPAIFASTGWGEGGAGTYRIGLRVRDQSTNGFSPSQWSDWTWQTLTVVMPLTAEASLSPNPALSGLYLQLRVSTSGYADRVEVSFPETRWFNWGDVVALEPDDEPATAKDNTWSGEYRTNVKTPDGPYEVTVIVYRTDTAPQTITIPLELIIQGDMYDQIRIRIRSHGLPGDWEDAP